MVGYRQNTVIFLFPTNPIQNNTIWESSADVSTWFSPCDLKQNARGRMLEYIKNLKNWRFFRHHDRCLGKKRYISTYVRNGLQHQVHLTDVCGLCRRDTILWEFSTVYELCGCGRGARARQRRRKMEHRRKHHKDLRWTRVIKKNNSWPRQPDGRQYTLTWSEEPGSTTINSATFKPRCDFRPFLCADFQTENSAKSDCRSS